MDTITVKRKEFNIVEKLGDKSYKVERKGKCFYCKDFKEAEAYQNFIDAYKDLSMCGVSVPKLIRKDKNLYTVLLQYIEGKNPLQELLKGELDDVYYEQIFKNSFYAKADHINLDFAPDRWVLMDNKLYYLSTYYAPYKESENFINMGVKLWFYTKQFEGLLKQLDIPTQPERLKEEYATNKEIVLKTCKFYR